MSEIGNVDETRRETIERRLQDKVMETLAAQGPATFVVSFVNVGLIYLVLRATVPTYPLATWAFVVIFFNALRWIMVLYFWRRRDTYKPRSWQFTYLLLVYCTGAGWGVLPMFPAFITQLEVQAFVVFVITGMSAGGLISLYVVRSAAVPYFIIVITPMIVVLANSGGPYQLGMAVLASMFLVLLIRSAFYLNTMVRRMIRTEVENEALFSFLTYATRHEE